MAKNKRRGKTKDSFYCFNLLKEMHCVNARFGLSRKVCLGNANLSEVNARSADLTDANFTGAKLDEVVWKGAKVEGSKFEESVQKQI